MGGPLNDGEHSNSSKTCDATTASNTGVLESAVVITEITKLFDERFDSIEKNISKIIDRKLHERTETNAASTSYADKLTKNIDTKLLGNVITAAKNTEKIQERERQKRENNLIIYGVVEDLNCSDEQYIKEFLNIICVPVKPNNIIRLGRKEEGRRPRPIKLVMQNPAQKEQIMRRLVNLKNAEDKFRKISVREDLSFEERALIKEWVEKAELKNMEENTDEYKVRGNPKNGLRLVRLTKQTRKDKYIQPPELMEEQNVQVPPFLNF